MTYSCCPTDFIQQLTNKTNGLFSESSAKQIQKHVTSHRYFLGLKLKRQPSWYETVESYKNEVFFPIYTAIYSWDFDVSFPKKKKGSSIFQISYSPIFFTTEQTFNNSQRSFKELLLHVWI